MEHGEGGRENRHSRMGIASFVISILVVVAILALVVGAPLVLSSTDALDAQSFDPADPQSIDLSNPAIIALQVIGLGFILGVLLSFVGFGLGVAGLIQRRRKRLFAIVGAVLNGLVILGVAVLILLAVAVGAPA
ncbi:MAG: hypothetical protein AVDCRST_MAG25-773 [uncultured Rubrobacteraceae bacterium]|uniref:Uncharacterized protein n=1 Tax=uncultured Rubrobacteraceae bacterium TaxID=349277 RepID=A0A6J4R087_9ACTN|nr:MAG: hypothetical protein AVDCRST_MAG25-773 [uncultured Rubrobacteraceae bacterium]